MAIAQMTSAYQTRRDTGARISTIESINRLKDAGFTQLDLNLCTMPRPNGIFQDDDWEQVAYAVREEAERIGVTFIQSHTPFYTGRQIDPAKPEFNEFFYKMMMRSAEINRICGVPVTVLHPMHARGFSFEDTEAHIAENKRFYGELLDNLTKYGVCAAFENMIAPTIFGATVRNQMDLMDALPDHNVALCWDVGHGNIRHPDQCWAINQLKGRIRAVHLHDNKGEKDDHLLPFLGTIPWEKVMPALRNAGFTGDLVLEVAQNTNMDDSLKDESTRFTASVCKRLLELYEG